MNAKQIRDTNQLGVKRLRMKTQSENDHVYILEAISITFILGILISIEAVSDISLASFV